MIKYALTYKSISVLLFIWLLLSVMLGALLPVSAQEKTTPTPQSDSSSRIPSALPEDGINLTLSPPALNLIADPGESIESQIKITNNNNFTEYLRIDIAKFQAAEGGERPLISEMSNEDKYKDWVEFEEEEFTVAPNEVKTVKFTLSPPKNASLGYYYAFIVNRVQQKDSQDGGAVIAGAPAVLTLLEVRSPNAVRELQVSRFGTDSLFYEYLPTTFQVTVKNSGNIHISPVGDIFIDSMSSKDIAAMKINAGRANVLPATERTFEVAWSDGFAVRVPKIDAVGMPLKNDKGETQYETNYDFSQADKFRFGKYTAHLLLAYNNGQRDIPLQASVSFWVIPWKIIGGVLLILILALVGLKNAVYAPIKRAVSRTHS